MARAKARLSARLRVLYLQRINHKKYPKQPTKKGTKRVSFSGVTTVCQYSQTMMPALALIRRPSTLKKLPKQTLIFEAKRLNIYKRGENEDTMRKAVGKEWRKQIRAELSEAGITESGVRDEDLEAFYNLYRSIKLGALVQMANPAFNPRTAANGKLAAFMKEHHLANPDSASPLARIAAVDTYLAEHVERERDGMAFPVALESLIGGLDHKRLSASSMSASKYTMYSFPMLQEELRSHGITPAPSPYRCRALLTQLMEKKLDHLYHKAFQVCLEDTLALYGVRGVKKNAAGMLLRLFEELRTRKEQIPVVTL